jgi:hypothetical protein
MPTDTNISQLVINKLTKEQYNQALEDNAIVDTELYFIIDDIKNSITGNVGDFLVIGENGQIVTKSFDIAEEMSY